MPVALKSFKTVDHHLVMVYNVVGSDDPRSILYIGPYEGPKQEVSLRKAYPGLKIVKCHLTPESHLLDDGVIQDYGKDSGRVYAKANS